ncbi:MAG: hypothetical protein DRQ88_08000 [Epsilonproteobacteria bacterium]|nr:MAG: hypothetical protein DRQ89_05585 [Campylobacterota bacterium]RLA66065.1 MAG: hypothetical protein DRQ88_08000 [Campylobacterota bacterium]
MKHIFVFVLLTFTLSSFAENLSKVFYGEDDRFNIKNSPEARFQIQGLSVAHMISEDLLEPAYDGVLTKVLAKPLHERFSMCLEERYAKELSAGKCSGFLVASDLLVTAGHCIWGQSSCDDNKWIFDFRNDFIYNGGNPDLAFVSSEDVYGCKEVINRKYNRETTKNDFALIRLDRPVTDRKPLKIRSEGKVSDDSEIVMIGHPLGLSLKISYKGKILKNDNPFYFKTNLDSFSGNSGSPVFNKKTGVVEGILVRGELDFLPDSSENCNTVNRCKETGESCEGEDVTRITVIPELVPGMTPSEEVSAQIEEPDADDSVDWNEYRDDIDDDEINWDCYINNENCGFDE